MRKGFLGSGFGASSFDCFGGTLAFLGVGGFAREYMIATGAMRRMFRRIGVLAYKVVARRMAPILRRKSTANAIGVYGLKKFCRDCRADQSTTAAGATAVT